MKHLLTLFMIVLACAGYGQTYTGPIVTYTFNDNSLVPSGVVGGVASNFTSGSGVTTPPGNPGAFPSNCNSNPEYSQRDWRTASATAAITGNDFFRFSFTSGAAAIMITSISFNEYRTTNGGNTGPTNFQVFFNLNDASPVLTLIGGPRSTNTTCTAHTISPVGGFLLPENRVLTVQIAGYGSNSANQDWSIDDVTLNATIILPIELSYFRAKPQINSVLLEWQTESESDNDYMAVERSIDGRNFSEVGRVAGAGTRATPIEYRFLDDTPLPGINYYRLRQVDYDGSTTYHQVVSAEVSGKETRLFPTVANEQVTLQFSQPSETSNNLEVRDLNGRILLRKSYAAGTTTHELSIQSLPAGSYILTVVGGERQGVHRFVKH